MKLLPGLGIFLSDNIMVYIVNIQKDRHVKNLIWNVVVFQPLTCD